MSEMPPRVKPWFRAAWVVGLLALVVHAVAVGDRVTLGLTVTLIGLLGLVVHATW